MHSSSIQLASISRACKTAEKWKQYQWPDGTRCFPFKTSYVFSAYRVRAGETPPRIILHPSDVVVKLGNPARFSCGAEGSPEVSIEWLRNGHPLNSSAEDGKMQPSVLPDGSLLFLSVGGGRGAQSHEGLYACVARNSAGKATSRNASLYIAGKAEDFFIFFEG